MPQEINIFEITGVIFGFISVYFAARESVWSWPTGIISVVVYTVFYFQITLYASMYLQFFFFASCIYGWYEWMFGGENKTKLKITKISSRHAWILFLLFVILSFAFGYIFDGYSDDHIPYMDALVTSLSVVAQWMLNKKIIENWLVWIVADAAYAAVHLYMENYPSAFLYIGYLFFATAGYILWKKTFNNSQMI